MAVSVVVDAAKLSYREELQEMVLVLGRRGPGRGVVFGNEQPRVLDLGSSLSKWLQGI